MRNAIILAAGTSSRFVPLSEECPKGLLEVKGEILIERQIRMLKDAGVDDVTLVVGFKEDMFSYLKPKYGVDLVYNEDYSRYNNTSSIMRVLDRMQDTYICCSDIYYSRNVFEESPRRSYYSACHHEGDTGEYCIRFNSEGVITDVTVGGRDSWYMIGHAFFSSEFSRKFKDILRADYEDEAARRLYWEDVYIRHIGELPSMEIKKWSEGVIEEFDTLDELRNFDKSYIDDTRSSVIKEISRQLGCGEADLHSFSKICEAGMDRFTFLMRNDKYIYDFKSRLSSRL